jgi:AraC family cel operon transcriptional repressor
MRLAWLGRARSEEGCELIRLTCRSGALYAAHDHEFPEIFWVEDGVCCHLVGGSRLDLSAGSLVFIRPRDLHQLRADAGPFTICNVTLNPAWAEDLALRHGAIWRWAWPSGGMPRQVTLNGTDLAQMRTWFESLWQQAPDRLSTEGFVLDVLRLVVPRRQAAREAAPKWLRDSLAQLRDPVVFQGGVPALARAAGVSREHLARACRRFRGRSPSDLVGDARLDHACRLLRYSDSDVTSIAAACGFGGPAQFYRRFSTRFGCAPAAWRRSGGTGIRPKP